MRLGPGRPPPAHPERAPQEPRAHLQQAGVVLILQDKPALSVVFVPVQLHNERLLVYVQSSFFFTTWNGRKGSHGYSAAPATTHSDWHLLL